MSRYTIRFMKFKILEVLSHPSVNRQHKINLIGRSSGKGFLELHLGETFGPEDRVLADRAFEQLKAMALIRPTYGDSVDPEKWVEITEAGRQALERNTLSRF